MNRYSDRRERLMKSLPDDSVVLLFSGNAPYRSADETYEFCVDRNFYYLTGLDAEDMVVMLSKINGSIMERIFILPYDETMAKWVGGRLLPETVKEISKIAIIEDREDLDMTIASLMNRYRLKDSLSFYFDFWHYDTDQADTQAQKYARNMQEQYPYCVMKDIYPMLTKCV